MAKRVKISPDPPVRAVFGTPETKMTGVLILDPPACNGLGRSHLDAHAREQSRFWILGSCGGKQFLGREQMLQCLLQITQVVMVDGDLKLFG